MSDNTPSTAAGRTLIAAWRHVSVPWMEQQVAAIEAEARADLRAAIRDALDRVLAEMRPIDAKYRETTAYSNGWRDAITAIRDDPALSGDTAPEPQLDLDTFIAETFTVLRRRLVGTPPNVDMTDAVIGYALNDCEAAINAALAHDEPTWAHNAQNDPAGLYDDQWEPISVQPVPTPEDR